MEKKTQIIDNLPENLSLNYLTYCFKNCPITSVDEQRSFSIYENLPTSNLRPFKLEKIKKSLIIQCNFQGKKMYSKNSKGKSFFIFQEN